MYTYMKMTSAEGKLMNYIDQFIYTDKFQKQASLFRHKYHIPKSGFVFSEANQADLKSMSILHLPIELGNDNKLRKSMHADLSKISKRLLIQTTGLRQCIRLYLFYGQLIADSIFNQQKENLCKISDLALELEEHGAESENKFLMTTYVQGMLGENDIYPIAIRIHPQAGQRDITDFVKKNWHYIQHLQLKYLKAKKQMQKIKSTIPKNRVRDRFIFENKDLPYKQIGKILNTKKFNPGVNTALDTGEIGKIISNQKKKRRQV